MNNYLIIRGNNNQKIALVKNSRAISNGLCNVKKACLTNADVISGGLPDIIRNDTQLFVSGINKTKYITMVGIGITRVLDLNISEIPFNSDEEAILYYELQ